ncbi:MAG: hypothetical protein O9283_11365 [Sphingomonadaceae bacterium]|nr:hypothetical protein [Sphingomonadaceae bacterium]
MAGMATKRGGFWQRLGAAALLSSALSTPVQAQSADTCRRTGPQAVASYNYILGTQAIGGRYRFTKDSPLLEEAEVIRTMGSNLLKLSFAKGAAARYGSVAAAGKARSTLEYVKAAPEVQRALDMDFKYYQAWVHSYTEANWRDGVTKAEARLYYDEMYQLSAWLLARYSGSGKVFMLGNWEGDWLLHGSQGRDSTPSPVAIQGMIDWLNIRQKAIDDAKAAVKHRDVGLYHYVEVNLVKKAMAGKPSIAFSVLPETNVDLVSYSSYEAIKKSQVPDLASIRQPLTEIMQYLEGQLRPKPGLPFSRRVFIGEYGYHANRAKPETISQQYLKSRYVMQVAIELDLPFALIWQVYNNEYTPDGTSKEMSLIDESGQKRELYYLNQQYLREMKAFVADSCQRAGTLPTREAFKGKALEVLESLTFERMQQAALNGGVAAGATRP